MKKYNSACSSLRKGQLDRLISTLKDTQKEPIQTESEQIKDFDEYMGQTNKEMSVER